MKSWLFVQHTPEKHIEKRDFAQHTQDKKSTFSDKTDSVGFSLCKKYVIMIRQGAKIVNYTKQIREYCEKNANSLIDISIVRNCWYCDYRLASEIIVDGEKCNCGCCFGKSRVKTYTDLLS